MNIIATLKAKKQALKARLINSNIFMNMFHSDIDKNPLNKVIQLTSLYFMGILIVFILLDVVGIINLVK